MKRAIVFVLLATMCFGAEPARQHHRLYRVSQFALAAAKAADIGTSWGQQELNPALGRGTFGPRQAIISGSMIGGLLVFEDILVHRSAHVEKPAIYVNFAVAAATGVVAAHNGFVK